jgi:4-aminobutyrate aminotransferase/(S)-3-amino-2-methylpropionate transaminase
MTLGLTGKISPYKNRFGPFPGDLWRAPFPIAYHGVSVEDALGALAMLFKTDVAPEDCAAMIVEPVQGEGGFYPAPDAFLQALRKICDDHGIVLILDEIQSGFARTGRFFACEHAGVEPDLMTVAKGLAGGFPLSAVVGKTAIMDAPAPGGLGGTYAGSPVGCAAALAVIEAIEDESLVARSAQIGVAFSRKLNALQKTYPDLIGDIRADRGAMIAIELVHDGNAGQPNPTLAKAILAECYRRGLIVLTCGMDGNVFRFLPALTISDVLFEEGLAIFEGALKAAAGR